MNLNIKTLFVIGTIAILLGATAGCIQWPYSPPNNTSDTNQGKETPTPTSDITQEETPTSETPEQPETPDDGDLGECMFCGSHNLHIEYETGLDPETGQQVTYPVIVCDECGGKMYAGGPD